MGILGNFVTHFVHIKGSATLKRSNCITLSLSALITVGAVASAAPPPLDRPTPPACCADGYCYPNPTTFGVYQRRWRRWPTEALEPTPAGVTPPSRLVPDIPPFDLPRPEEEDRRAPPPTQPPEPAEQEEGEPAPGTEIPRAAPVAPPGGGTAPPTRMLPFENDALENELTPLPFGEPAIPAPAPLPFGEPAAQPPAVQPFLPPTGDLDPPPAPRFGSPSRAVVTAANASATGAAARPAAHLERPVAQPTQRKPSHDPPPPLPLSLANAGF